MLDLVESGALNLSGVRFFVLDEADRLLDAGNQGDMLRLFARMPRSGPGFKSLQVLLFSAHVAFARDFQTGDDARVANRRGWTSRAKNTSQTPCITPEYVVDPGSEDPAALVPAAPVDNMHGQRAAARADGAAESVVFGDETTETPRRSARRGRAQDGPVFDFLSHQFRLR